MNESRQDDSFDNRLKNLLPDHDKAQQLIVLRQQFMADMTHLRETQPDASSASVAYLALKMMQDFFNSYSQLLTDAEYQTIFELSKEDTQKALNEMPEKIAHNTVH